MMGPGKSSSENVCCELPTSTPGKTARCLPGKIQPREEPNDIIKVGKRGPGLITADEAAAAASEAEAAATV